MRVLGVDWSGAHAPSHQRRAIWVADADDGALCTLHAGRTRDETLRWLLEDLEHRPETLVAIDFSFGFPAWWGRHHGAATGPDMWQVAAEQGEEWLSVCPDPFWGRPGRPRPVLGEGQSGWRTTELELAALGMVPKSTFQVGGAGAVGTGSIRGMPVLLELRRAGAAVWPFDPWPSSGPVVVEAYPRWCTGPVVKSRTAARMAWTGRRFPAIPEELAWLVHGSEDAFDAAATALTLSQGSGQPPPDGPDDVLEGRVWAPPAVSSRAV